MKTAEPHRNKEAIKAESQDEDSKGWQLEQITREFHLQQLKKLFAEDPVLRVLKPKLIGSIQGPVSPPKVTSNQLEALRRLI